MARTPSRRSIFLLLLLVVVSPHETSAQWVRAQGLDGQSITAIADLGGTVYAGASGILGPPSDTIDHGGVFRSTDGGHSWRAARTGLPRALAVENLAVTDSGLLAATSNGFYLSRDSGATWLESTTGFPGYLSPVTGTLQKDVSALLAVGKRVLAAAGYGGVYVSSDGGTSWQQARSGLPEMGLARALIQVGSRTLVGYSDRAAYVSVDTGSTWTLPGPSSPGSVSCFTRGAGYLYAGLTYSGISRSADSGMTWTKIASSLGSVAVRELAVRGDTLLAGTIFDGLLLSTNGGQSWRPVNEGLPSDSKVIQALLIRGSEVLLGHVRGVWYRSLSELVTSVQSEQVFAPQGFHLEQNYPNPFNPSTTIRYSLPHRSHATLIVYNTLGQKVVELVNRDIGAGYHSVQFNANHLASGVYFYRLQAGTYGTTKKLVLTR